MKKLLTLFALLPLLLFGQTTPTIKQVLSAGNNASGKSLVGAALIGLNGATSGTVSVNAPAIVTTYTFTLPANDGTSGQYLQTDGSGVASWQTVSSGITVGTTAIASGTSGAIPFNNAGVYGEDATQLFWDNANNRLGVGTNAPAYNLDVVGGAQFTGNVSQGFVVNATSRTNAFTIDGTGYIGFGTASPGQDFLYTKSTAATSINASFQNTAASGWVNISALTDAGLTYLGATGSTAAPGGIFTSRTSYLYCNGNTNGLQIISNSGNIIFYSNGSSAGNEIMRMETQAANIGYGGTGAASTRFSVKGAGATSATNCSLSENSNGDDILTQRDDRVVITNGRLETSQGTDVASSSTITITYTGNVFELTGTTAVNFITTTGWQEGSELTFIANENVTINDDAGGGNLRLAGNANFAMTADDVLTLIYSSTTAGGIIWREKSRSVN